jgi:hypothetical protein
LNLLNILNAKTSINIPVIVCLKIILCTIDFHSLTFYLKKKNILRVNFFGEKTNYFSEKKLALAKEDTVPVQKGLVLFYRFRQRTKKAGHVPSFDLAEVKGHRPIGD